MKKNISILFIICTGLIMSGCVSKMVGGAVDVVTLGIVKNDVKETKNPHNKPLTKIQS
jgi:PBP1b-binding outer membrane lipoprotein LpoB